MTEKQSKTSLPVPEGGGSPSSDRTSPMATGNQRSSAGAISAGLEYLEQHYSQWDCSIAGDAWVGACVLARLRELPEPEISNSLRRRMETALNNLMRAHAASIAPSSKDDAKDDAELIARTIVAFRAGGRQLPQGILQSLGRCRQTDGGFALSAEDSNGSAPEITVTAIQALRTMDRSAEEFLSARMQNDESQLTTWLSVCAGILDWDKGLAPLALLNQACRMIVRARPQSAFEHALLLRCLIRLRLQQAWVAAAELRRLQLENGSWPGPSPRRPGVGGVSFNPDIRNLIPTVTAVSAIALCEAQPGLYFGSDSPQPRRLYES